MKAGPGASGRGIAELKIPGFMGSPMRGTFAYADTDRFRMEMEGYDFKITLVENGRDFWQSYEKGMNPLTIRLKPGTLTDEEYFLARWVGGFGGFPLLSPAQYLAAASAPHVVRTEPDGGEPHDVVAFDVPTGLDGLVSKLLATQADLSGGTAADTLWLSVRRKDGWISRVRGVGPDGAVVSDLILTEEPAGGAADFDDAPPDHPVVGAESLVMLLSNNGTKWLEGRQIPMIEVETADAAPVAVASRRGPLVINFWATWCGPCLIEWPVLQKLFDKYRDSAEFFMITNEPAPGVLEFQKTKGYTAPIYFDGMGRAGSRLAVNAIPVTLFVGRDGRVSSVHVGFPRYPTLDRTRTALFEKYDRILKDLLTGKG